MQFPLFVRDVQQILEQERLCVGVSKLMSGVYLVD